ncbi:MAG: Trm112 family protein [Flavobacteriaceae bacterium]|nr:Trm112 family protein [Flavobacteriaceae bacterium]
MKLSTIKKLCCPFDKSDLELKPVTLGQNDDILEGILICEECERVYPIVSGIPIMSPDEFRDFQMEQPLLEKWMKQLGMSENIASIRHTE